MHIAPIDDNEPVRRIESPANKAVARVIPVKRNHTIIVQVARTGIPRSIVAEKTPNNSAPMQFHIEVRVHGHVPPRVTYIRVAEFRLQVPTNS